MITVPPVALTGSPMMVLASTIERMFSIEDLIISGILFSVAIVFIPFTVNDKIKS
jgi:hypothetical protein